MRYKDCDFPADIYSNNVFLSSKQIRIIKLSVYTSKDFNEGESSNQLDFITCLKQF
jgi:hypothetical protein